MRPAPRFALALLSCVFIAACSSLTIQPTGTMNAMDTTMGSYREAGEDRYIIVTMTDSVHEQLVQGERVDRESALPPVYAKFIGNLARTYGMKRVADWPLDTLGIRCLVFEVADPSRRDAIIAALGREQFVESAQRLSGFSTSGEPATAGSDYNDPYRKLQPALDAMQVVESHRWATGKGVRVAVIDTGLDTGHPDLRDRVVGIRNFVDRDDGAFNTDVHGTAVAGVIAATSNNGVGLVGVAPEAEVVGLKACWQMEKGARCSTFTLAKALNFAIDQQVDVINLSLGGPPDALLTRLVDKARESNILVVGAVSPDWPKGFPAGVDSVIAVANAAVASNPDAPDALSAPGNQVLSARPHGDYDFYTGSSFSAAQISGLSALIRQRKPHLSGQIVKELIATTAQPGERHLANACRALARVVADGSCGPSHAATPPSGGEH